MTARIAWAWLGVMAIAAGPPVPGSAPTAGLLLWQKGQAALAEGDPARAIPCFEDSLLADPALHRNHLSLAACHLALGDDARAAQRLERYLQLQPEHVAARAHYAELLLRQENRAAAREQFEQFAADAQTRDDVGRQHLVHCHTRLMEIAEAAADRYAEHLHRGIGLYHLALQQARSPAADEELNAEAILCRAAGELSLAQHERPTEPRPCWYLHIVWSRLAQAQPAARWLRKAQEAAPLGHLTAAERSSLQLAERSGPSAK